MFRQFRVVLIYSWFMPKANNKKGVSNGVAGDYGSDSGSTTGGVKRSRSNSSSLVRANPLSPTQAQAQSALLSQLNITLNCHYCWAQFQLNVSKNLKNSIQQKENGKYMQHLALHLNAPYKCNECSYPIMDTKTFYKHKQFYKHDEKTCIMVDNDINLPTTGEWKFPALWRCAKSKVVSLCFDPL